MNIKYTESKHIYVNIHFIDYIELRREFGNEIIKN